jgi:hypothetical protein
MGLSNCSAVPSLAQPVDLDGQVDMGMPQLMTDSMEQLTMYIDNRG